MTTWVLVILFGISSWGAGGARAYEYPDKASCYEALAAVKITDDKSVIVYCYPKGGNK